jgi:small subunit ribosomal protein S5
LVPNQLVEETSSLLGKLKKTKATNCFEIKERLFEIFLQRTDKIKLAHDFEKYRLIFGLSKLSDLGNQFPDYDEVPSTETSNKAEIPEEKIVKETAIDRKILDPTVLRDEDGKIWSGSIVHTDMVQKTMPGNRIASHRALVVIGNLRGTGGFGMGKGKNVGDAVNAAFRAALKNLIHIDLYENYGFAHNLLGKHNSCRAYIQATPRSRIMVGSTLAKAVLNHIGVSSASVKLVGRRNPYSMVHAIFDALSKHENIDEFAKRRGKRFLTLKWLRENQI